MNKRLYKSSRDIKISGVCGGIAEFFQIDPTVVRVLYVLFSFLGGSGLLVYIACSMIMPRDPGTDDMRDREPRDDDWRRN